MFYKQKYFDTRKLNEEQVLICVIFAGWIH